MSKSIDFNKLKEDLIDKGTELITKVIFLPISKKSIQIVAINLQVIKDATDGAVSVESIVKGQIKVDANAYVDKAVTLLNNKLESNNLDASDLPDLGFDFEHDVACGIVVPGTVDIQDGTINGLANFCRTGDSELKINVRSAPDTVRNMLANFLPSNYLPGLE